MKTIQHRATISKEGKNIRRRRTVSETPSSSDNQRQKYSLAFLFLLLSRSFYENLFFENKNISFDRFMN